MRPIQLLYCVTYLTVLVLLFDGGGQVRAQGYDLSILAKKDDVVVGKTVTCFASRNLNDDGLVTFQGLYEEGGFSREGNFTFDGTTGTFLISVSQDGPPEDCGGKMLSGGSQRSLSIPRLNNNGLATFFARLAGSGHGVFTHDGTTCRFIELDGFSSQGGLLEKTTITL